MDWIQFTIMIVSFVGLFFWNRSESRNDIRLMDQKIEENRRETNAIIGAIHQQILAIHDEIKDFHGRLCAIDEARKIQK